MLCEKPLNIYLNQIYTKDSVVLQAELEEMAKNENVFENLKLQSFLDFL